MLPQSIGVVIRAARIDSWYTGHNLRFNTVVVRIQIALIGLAKEMGRPGTALLAAEKQPYCEVDNLVDISLFSNADPV